MMSDIVVLLTVLLAFSITSILIALPASVVVLPIFCFIRKLVYIPFVRGKLIEEAKEKGNVVTARLVKSHDDYDYRNDSYLPNGAKIGVYAYQCGEKTYKYRCSSRNTLPKEMTLYFLSNPRKVSTVNDIGIRETPKIIKYWIIIFLTLFFAILISMIALVYIQGLIY